MDIVLNPQLKSKTAIALKKISSKREIVEDKEYDGYLIEGDEKIVRSITEFLKSKKEKKVIAILGRDDEFNRRVIETCKIDYLVSPERGHVRDTLKQRDSGLNHVVAKEAVKKNISIVIDFSSLVKFEKKFQARVLARIMQNIKICRKAKCHIKIATFAVRKEDLRDEFSLRSFCFSLGMSSEQVRDAVQ